MGVRLKTNINFYDIYDIYDIYDFYDFYEIYDFYDIYESSSADIAAVLHAVKGYFADGFVGLIER